MKYSTSLSKIVLIKFGGPATELTGLFFVVDATKSSFNVYLWWGFWVILALFGVSLLLLGLVLLKRSFGFFSRPKRLTLKIRSHLLNGNNRQFKYYDVASNHKFKRRLKFDTEKVMLPGSEDTLSKKTGKWKIFLQQASSNSLMFVDEVLNRTYQVDQPPGLDFTKLVYLVSADRNLNPPMYEAFDKNRKRYVISLHRLNGYRNPILLCCLLPGQEEKSYFKLKITLRDYGRERFYHRLFDFETLSQETVMELTSRWLIRGLIAAHIIWAGYYLAEFWDVFNGMRNAGELEDLSKMKIVYPIFFAPLAFKYKNKPIGEVFLSILSTIGRWLLKFLSFLRWS